MTRTGRKPLAVGHVDHLQGSEHARQRMRLILQAMMGELTVPEACRQMGVCESRFHALRKGWLQGALELLEPRRTGRPPHAQPTEELAQRARELAMENRQLREQLQAAEVRQQIAELLPPGSGRVEPVKKTAHPAAPRKNRARQPR